MRDNWRRQRNTTMLLGAFLIIIAIALLVWFADSNLRGSFSDASVLRRVVQSEGAWGPAMLICLQVLQVIIMPLPGQAVGLAAGYIFGPWMGLLYAFAGLAIGRGLILWLSRRFGRPLVRRMVSPALQERIDALARRRGASFFFLVFLFPFLPDDAACFAAGLSPLRLGELWLLSLIGGLPGLSFSVWVGYCSTKLSLQQILLIGSGMLLLAAGFWRWQNEIEARLLALIDRISPRRLLTGDQDPKGFGNP